MGQIWDFLRSVSVHFESLFKISFSTDLKKSQICPIWGQSAPIWMANLRLQEMVISPLRECVVNLCRRRYNYISVRPDTKYIGFLVSSFPANSSLSKSNVSILFIEQQEQGSQIWVKWVQIATKWYNSGNI